MRPRGKGLVGDVDIGLVAAAPALMYIVPTLLFRFAIFLEQLTLFRDSVRIPASLNPSPWANY
jgi:hypothetical protein